MAGGTAPFFTAKFTPAAGGSYTFVAVVTDIAGNRTTSAPATVTVSTGVVDGWAELRVADDGRGIPAENLDRIFDSALLEAFVIAHAKVKCAFFNFPGFTA